MNYFEIVVKEENYFNTKRSSSEIAALLLTGTFPEIEKYFTNEWYKEDYELYINNEKDNILNENRTNIKKKELYRVSRVIAKQIIHTYRSYCNRSDKSKYRLFQVIHQLYLKGILNDLDLSVILKESLLDVGFNNYNDLSDFIVRTNPELVDKMVFVYDNKEVDIIEYLTLMHDYSGADRISEIRIRNLPLEERDKSIVRLELIKSNQKRKNSVV